MLVMIHGKKAASTSNDSVRKRQVLLRFMARKQQVMIFPIHGEKVANNDSYD